MLLAFNRAAAGELQERIDARLTAAGIDSAGIRASTFHSFRLSLIGSTGSKPRLAPWLDGGGDVRVIDEIVDALRDNDETFRAKWDMYRLLFAGAPTTNEPDDPDTYDKATSAAGFRTFAGELVKSRTAIGAKAPTSTPPVLPAGNERLDVSVVLSVRSDC